MKFSQRASRLMYIPFMAVFVTGVILGFMGNWWGKLWIWAAIGVGIVLSIVMSGLGTLYYDRVRIALGLPPTYGKQKNPSGTMATPDEFNALLSTSTPILLGIIGAIGLYIILWLMTSKPF